jgi:hypothetical protein
MVPPARIILSMELKDRTNEAVFKLVGIIGFVVFPD